LVEHHHDGIVCCVRPLGAVNNKGKEERMGGRRKGRGGERGGMMDKSEIEG